MNVVIREDIKVYYKLEGMYVGYEVKYVTKESITVGASRRSVKTDI